MPLSDFSAILTWWVYLFAIGLFFLPLTLYLFPRFKDGGYIFSKTIGALILSYVVFLLSSFNIVNFDRSYIFAILILSGLAIWLYFLKRPEIAKIKSDKSFIRFIIFEEGIFLTLFVLYAVLRSFQPDIYGIEKFMNFGFINSILRTENFPPQDQWFSGESINYYYFGHLFSAVLIKLTNIPSNISFNLMLASTFALIFTSSFSLFIVLFSFFSKPLTQRLKIKFLLSCLISAFIVTLSGNLQVIYSFFEEAGNKIIPFWKLSLAFSTFPNFYWYPSATRFIENAIHEFPGYALILSDLHAHLLNTPFTILTIAFLLSIFLKYRQKESKNSLTVFDALFLSFILSVLFMGNSWDLFIYFFLGLTVIFLIINKRSSIIATIWDLVKITSFVILATFLFSLPFLIHFKPFVEGIGINCSPLFLTEIGKIGPLLFEKNYCQTTPIWQFMLIYGFFIFFAASFIIFLRNLKGKKDSDIFVSILFFAGLVLVIVPEVIYLKDIYPSYFRANTMFKLSYSSFVILSFASSYSLFRIIDSINRKDRKKVKAFIVNLSFITISLLLIFITSLYPVLAINSYYNNFASFKGLDGTKYLSIRYPEDYEAIKWINENIKNQEVMLEAAGDSYTDYGRISANTGLPTVVNWTAHQWLWRSSPEKALSRITDVESIYESSDMSLTKNLLDKYKISYIYIGELEKQKYNLNSLKFDNLGKVIYSSKESKIYKISL